MATSYDIVVPTVGRPSLLRLLESLASSTGSRPGQLILVDDRRNPRSGILDEIPGPLLDRLEPVVVLRGRAAGPAAARNAGWRHSDAEWVAFLDDDVEVDADWCERLDQDLSPLDASVAASQGRLHVPLPAHRRPTDWERNVAGLERAQWATADMAYRRRVLAAVDGFDERFGRAYREDADLGLRVTAAGWTIVTGERSVRHPVRPAAWHVSVELQRGNADDALMDRIHGRGWRDRAGAPPGRRRDHLITCAAWAVGAFGTLTGRRALTAVGLGGAGVLTARFATARARPGPRTAAELAGVAVTSVAIPPAAAWWWFVGLWRARRLVPVAAPEPVDVVLFDRDGTLIHDVPYNGDAGLVEPVPGARAGLERLRGSGLRIGMVSNQSGVARGLLEPTQVEEVNRRVEELLGPFDVITWCAHGPDDGCACRKPSPGMVLEAAARLGVPPSRCAVIGDIGADVEAARRAGARGILVPTEVTRTEEIADADEVVADLGAAIARVAPARRRREAGAA